MARRWNPALHPRDRNGKFRRKGGGSSSNRSSNLQQNFSRVKTAYEVYSDVSDVASSGAKAVAYGASGNYVKSALHGAKAGVSVSRLGSRGAGAYVRNSDLRPAQKRKFYAAQATFDDRVQTVDNIATIGLFVTGSGLRRPSKDSPERDYLRRKTLKPAKLKRGAYQISAVKGGRVRR